MKVLTDTLFLAAHTSRSVAYAQGIAGAGIAPGHTLLFGSPRAGLPGQTAGGSGSNSSAFSGVALPNLERTLEESVGGWPGDIESVPETDVNADSVVAAVARICPMLVIYSGYGSQIVGRALLAGGTPFLHCHCGLLPQFRGSTTLYYSWLETGGCGVSAIILGETIDTGPIVKTKRYLPPPPEVDPDHIYDCAIRADLLVEVLEEYAQSGNLEIEANQDPDAGTNYYVIHPLLKHVARCFGH